MKRDRAPLGDFYRVLGRCRLRASSYRLLPTSSLSHQLDHRRSVVDIRIAARHVRLEVPFDISGMLHVRRSTLENILEEGAADAAEVCRHFRIEMAAQRRLSKEIVQ